MASLPQARPPLEVTHPPRVTLPPGACDAHVHVFAGRTEFARDPARTEDPAPGDLSTWCSRLQTRMKVLGLTRAVLIHSVIYRENCDVTEAALEALGPGFRGVALLERDVADATLDHLHLAGFRGIRLDLVYPGALKPDDLPALMPRLAERGWHVQVFAKWAEAGEMLADLAQTAPCPLVLDHFAYAPGAPNFELLRRTLGSGKLWVKLSSLYRQNPENVLIGLGSLVAENPSRLVWGSNWPHVRWDGAMPDEAALVDQIAASLSSTDIARVFATNAAYLYGFGD